MGPELDLRPQLERLDRLILRSEGLDPSALSFAFRPLWQLDAPAKAALALSKAQATQVYAGLNLWPAAVTARLVEAQLVQDGTYPNAQAVFAEAGTAGPASASPTLDFDPAQPRDLWGRWASAEASPEASEPSSPEVIGRAPDAPRQIDPTFAQLSKHPDAGSSGPSEAVASALGAVDPIATSSAHEVVPAAERAGAPASQPTPEEAALMTWASVLAAPLLAASYLRQASHEVARQFIKHLPDWLTGGLPPDPPPSAELAGSGSGKTTTSSRPLPWPPTIHGGASQAGTLAPAAGPAGVVGGSYSLNEQPGDPVKPDPRAAQKLDNALSDYQTRLYTLGSQPFQLDKGGMRHILERHAPEYWNGTTSDTQTFFSRSMTVEQIQAVVGDVLNQNRSTIIGSPSKYDWNLVGTSDGVRYNVTTYLGRITRLVPLP